jgi:hypothetical protein
MRSTCSLLLLILLSTFVSTGQDTSAIVREWLPMQIGDRWVYEKEWRGGDRNHPDVTRWREEDSTVAIQTTPEGTLVRRQVRLLDNTAPPPNLRIGPESNILIRDACIYYLRNGYGWNSALNQLSGEFKQDLAANKALPDVCFPLRAGQTWGDPNIGRDLWTVAGFGKKNADDPVSVTQESWRLEASLASGDDDYVWFQKGTGIIATRTYHNGTYDDRRVRLLQFEPGSSKR